jgi:hypothetical protein
MQAPGNSMELEIQQRDRAHLRKRRSETLELKNLINDRTKTDMKSNGTEDPDMNPRCYAHLIFDKGVQNMDSLFNKCCWENRISACRKQTRSMSSPCTSINSKWIKEPNIRPETLKLM